MDKELTYYHSITNNGKNAIISSKELLELLDFKLQCLKKADAKEKYLRKETFI